MYHVYVLISLKDHRLYIGFTTNIERRVQEHSIGKNISTKDRRPFKLIYSESYLTEKEAKRRELYLKGGKGRGELKIQLEQTLKDHKYKYL